MRTVSGGCDRIVVVGAGLAGLAAALHLAGRGREVTVLERGPGPGGRVGRADLGGYRLDTGPTVLTMPDVLEDTLAAVGESLHHRLTLMPLDPAYRAVFADGSSIDVHSDGERMAGEVRRFAGAGEESGYRRLRAWLTQLYRVEFDRFVATNADSPWDLLCPQLARLAALGGFRSIDSATRRFLADERLRRVFSFQSLYVGESPHRALALYAVIAYMDTVAGVYFPRGGMRALPDALAGAAVDAGIQLRYDRTVEALERRGSRATAVITEAGERFECDAVVLTTELPFAYRLLGRAPTRPRRLRAAPSAVVLQVGSRARWHQLGHHTLSFGRAWKSVFSEIIKHGRLMSDPSLLITRPTATDPTLAPEGRELLSVLAPVPNTDVDGRDWDVLGRAYAQRLAEHVEDRLLPDFGRAVEVEHLITPADWSRMGLVAGTPFSYSHSLTQTGPFRPSNFPRITDNVVLAGSSTVPGVGVPPALISGRLAADRITGALGRRPKPGTAVPHVGKANQ